MPKFCDKCGAELKNENAKFCDKCGAKVKFTSNTQSNNNNPNIPLEVNEKNMAIALLLSFIWSGLGLLYAGNMEKGIILVVSAIIVEILFLYVFGWMGIVVFIIWIYSMYATYIEVKEGNQEKRMLLMNSMNNN